jgi:hypothetical protein
VKWKPGFPFCGSILFFARRRSRVGRGGALTSGHLGEVAGETARKSKTWPDTPRALAGRLRRAATFLRKVGIEIVFQREGRARTRTIHIATAPDNAAARPSAPSVLSATAVEGRHDGRLPEHGPRMVASGAEDGQ